MSSSGKTVKELKSLEATFRSARDQNEREEALTDVCAVVADAAKRLNAADDDDVGGGSSNSAVQYAVEMLSRVRVRRMRRCGGASGKI